MPPPDLPISLASSPSLTDELALRASCSAPRDLHVEVVLDLVGLDDARHRDELDVLVVGLADLHPEVGDLDGLVEIELDRERVHARRQREFELAVDARSPDKVGALGPHIHTRERLALGVVNDALDRPGRALGLDLAGLELLGQRLFVLGDVLEHEAVVGRDRVVLGGRILGRGFTLGRSDDLHDEIARLLRLVELAGLVGLALVELEPVGLALGLALGRGCIRLPAPAVGKQKAGQHEAPPA